MKQEVNDNHVKRQITDFFSITTYTQQQYILPHMRAAAVIPQRLLEGTKKRATFVLGKYLNIEANVLKQW